MQTSDNLIQKYKDLYNNLDKSSNIGKDIEKSACVLYVSIFEKLKRKERLSKDSVVKFIQDDFYVQDKKRLQFKEDGMDDDAYLCAQVQQAYRMYWVEILELPLEGNLCARSIKPMFYPIDPKTSPLGLNKYKSVTTERTSSK